MGSYAIYLRKSRSDDTNDTLEETLSRHEKVLLQVAKKMGICITKIYREVVSGETIINRPEMLKLLNDVENKLYEGVLVVEIERLARGNGIDQGIIIQEFQNSNTKIITPNKTYDLNDEFDSESLEFGLFMSRREYKTITRRMQAGRVSSIKEGNYIATRPPYGYLVERKGKKERILIPHPEQSDVVKMIFSWYVNDNIGCGHIANKLNALGIKSYTGIKWESTALVSIIKNPIYIGKIVWKKKCIRKSKTPGKAKDTYTRDKQEWIISEGKHMPIIDTELFEKAQEIIKSKYHIPYQSIRGVANPLAGLIVCGICGSKMVRRPYGDKEPHLICINKCGTKGNKFKTVEISVLNSLKEYLESIKTENSNLNINTDTEQTNLLKTNISSLEKELQGFQKQRINVHNLFESGLYDIETFIDRSKYLKEQIESCEKSLKLSEENLKNIQNNRSNEFVENLKNVINSYEKTDDIAIKNILLKTVLNKIVFYKDKTCKNDIFKIVLEPKLFDFWL